MPRRVIDRSGVRGCGEDYQGLLVHNPEFAARQRNPLRGCFPETSLQRFWRWVVAG
jgi:hypothetical protein